MLGLHLLMEGYSHYEWETIMHVSGKVDPNLMPLPPNHSAQSLLSHCRNSPQGRVQGSQVQSIKVRPWDTEEGRKIRESEGTNRVCNYAMLTKTLGDCPKESQGTYK